MSLFKFSFCLIVLSFFTLRISAQIFERYRPLKDSTYTSVNLGYKKHIQVTVPMEYQDNLPQEFPLIVVFDTQNSRQYQYILRAIDYLTANEQMPSAVIVGVEAGKGGYRYRETQFKTSDSLGLAEKNEAYIFKELIPLMREKFKAGKFTALVGHSRYGFLTSYLMTQHVNELNAVIAMSPFITQLQVDLSKLIPDALKRQQPGHMFYYRYAMGNDYPKDYQTLTAALKASGINKQHFNADGWWFPQAEHNTTPALTIGRALYEIFEYWFICQKKYLGDDNENVSYINELKQNIFDHYGAGLPFSLGALNGKGYAFFNKKDYVNAILAWQELLKQDANFIQAYLKIAECQKALKRPYTQTIKDFKTQVEKSTIFPAEQKAEMLKEAEEM